MAKLYFRYGAMGSSKSANSLLVKYNYEERGQRVLLLKPSVDTRDGKSIVRSRIGIESRCEIISAKESISKRFGFHYDCIIVDEAQFLSKKNVLELSDLADTLRIPVICYGLRTDFKGELFEGSKWLLAYADAIEEIKTICWCGSKATFGVRLVNGKVTREGEQFQLGGNNTYVSLCRKHWKEGRLG